MDDQVIHSLQGYIRAIDLLLAIPLVLTIEAIIGSNWIELDRAPSLLGMDIDTCGKSPVREPPDWQILVCDAQSTSLLVIFATGQRHVHFPTPH